ncbi:hypothetical protein J7T55_001262 [Diaporthe amygdali]|uniref:uncharacterized protein n=1 Tax=Phomopsis amygdali TaxID=1214568 RepID=UPI0022FEF095|nr:uncharacterized protein J7T55_001262 [Diaporthe amygdali]KAJ0103890.1 hypothetical protein J7T55_001262 [Diaporthe amygdali]
MIVFAHLLLFYCDSVLISVLSGSHVDEGRPDWSEEDPAGALDPDKVPGLWVKTSKMIQSMGVSALMSSSAIWTPHYRTDYDWTSCSSRFREEVQSISVHGEEQKDFSPGYLPAQVQLSDLICSAYQLVISDLTYAKDAPTSISRGTPSKDMDGAPWWRERQVSLYGPDHEVIGGFQIENNFLGVENVHDSKRIFMYYPIPDVYLCGHHVIAPTVRILEPKKADLGIFQSGVTTCFDVHGKSCSVTESDEVPGLRLLNEKQEQIKRMAQICGNAELTMIAAPGNSQEQGLPGISAPRKSQPHAKIGDYTLVSTLTTPQVLVHASRWSSRAWTYQEALCSQRRLIFTDEPVFWESEQTSCREIVDYEWPLHECISTTSSTLTLFTASQQRQSVFQEGAAPIFHIWGLFMTTENKFLASMKWALKTPGRRRRGFPTWSWTATGKDPHAIVPVLLTEEVDKKTRNSWRQVPRDLLGVILADHLNLDGGQPLFVLVLTNVDSHFERIGHVKLDNRPGRHTDVNGEVLDSHYELCRREVAIWMRKVTFRHITPA